MTHPPPVYAGRVLAPLFLALSTAAVMANARQDESVLPGGPPPVTAPPERALALSSGDMQILALRAGREPYPWLVPGRIAKSFVTNSPETLDLVAFARLKAHPEADSRITWKVSPPAG